MGALLFSLEGARHFDHDAAVPSHFVATVIRGAINREAQLENEIAHLNDIIEQFCMDAKWLAEGHVEQREPRMFRETSPVYGEYTV